MIRDPPPPPPGVDPKAWEKFPLAKRRLIAEGPGEDSALALFDTLLIAAAEARQQGLSRTAAEKVARGTNVDGIGQQKARKQLRGLSNTVGRAYELRNGQPLLTGCPRDPAHSGNAGLSRLRSRFAPYCDEDCARTCPMLRAVSAAGAVLAMSRYDAIWRSTLWTTGARLGLGPSGKLVWEKTAIVALATEDGIVETSQRYIAAKLGDNISHRTVGKKLKTLHDLGLVTFDRTNGLRTVHALNVEQVRALEENYDTARIVTARRQAREQESEEYAVWLEEMPSRRAQWELAKYRRQ